MNNIIKNINLFELVIESTDWYPYRVKTKKEFIDQYGENWINVVFDKVGWNVWMYEILGMDYPERYFRLEDHNSFDEVRIRDKKNGHTWTIPCESLTKNKPNTPNYEPKKIDRTLESNSYEQSIIKKIQSVLTKDLLIPIWSKKLENGKHHPFAGHCYAASEALYHLLGGKDNGYKIMRGKGLNNEIHWWIVDKNNNILDPTAEQFYFVGLKPPYENGRGSGFLTKNPSRRAKEIISRIQNF